MPEVRDAYNREKSFKIYKRMAVKVADDFKYGSEVVQKIKSAKTSDEISEVMRDARIKKFNVDESVYIGPASSYKVSGHNSRHIMGSISATKFK